MYCVAALFIKRLMYCAAALEQDVTQVACTVEEVTVRSAAGSSGSLLANLCRQVSSLAVCSGCTWKKSLASLFVCIWCDIYSWPAGSLMMAGWLFYLSKDDWVMGGAELLCQRTGSRQSSCNALLATAFFALQRWLLSVHVPWSSSISKLYIQLSAGCRVSLLSCWGGAFGAVFCPPT